MWVPSVYLCDFNLYYAIIIDLVFEKANDQQIIFKFNDVMDNKVIQIIKE